MLGVAYKKDTDDVRESPALDIIELLRQKGADMRYHDPHVHSIHHNGFAMTGEPELDGALAAADCTVRVTDPSCYRRVAPPLATVSLISAHAPGRCVHAS